MPTKTHIRFGSRISTKGDRWAYFEGSAYLLDVRFFLGRGDDVVVSRLLVVRARLEEREGSDVEASSSVVPDAPLYLNFDRVPLKEAMGFEGGGGVVSLLRARAAEVCDNRKLFSAERVRAIGRFSKEDWKGVLK